MAILNSAQARKLFGTEEKAIGRRVRMGDAATGPALEVVGVVADQPPDGIPTRPPLVTFQPFL